MKTYEAEAHRHGWHWRLTIPGVMEGFYIAKSLSEARAIARAIICALTGVDKSEVTVSVRVVGKEADMAASVVKMRAEAKAAAVKANAAVKEAVDTLVAGGLSHRDIATLLELSPGRIGQLISVGDEE